MIRRAFKDLTMNTDNNLKIVPYDLNLLCLVTHKNYFMIYVLKMYKCETHLKHKS